MSQSFFCRFPLPFPLLFFLVLFSLITNSFRSSSSRHNCRRRTHSHSFAVALHMLLRQQILSTSSSCQFHIVPWSLGVIPRFAVQRVLLHYALTHALLSCPDHFLRNFVITAPLSTFLDSNWSHCDSSCLAKHAAFHPQVDASSSQYHCRASSSRIDWPSLLLVHACALLGDQC
jgi:hypothetical protein